MSSPPPQPELRLRAYTFTPRAILMPELGVAIDHVGGWVLERRTLSAVAIELTLEISVSGLQDLYAALIAVGVELAQDSHRAIAQRVTCGLYMPPGTGFASVLLIVMELQFRDPPARPLAGPGEGRAYARA